MPLPPKLIFLVNWCGLLFFYNFIMNDFKGKFPAGGVLSTPVFPWQGTSKRIAR